MVGRPQKTYSGTCNACGKQTKFVERDHRVPVRLGGEQNHRNLQDLCLECHRAKNLLEVTLFDLDGSTETVREWFRLAFQDDTESIAYFIGELSMRVSHFREVLRSMGWEPAARVVDKSNLAWALREDE